MKQVMPIVLISLLLSFCASTSLAANSYSFSECVDLLQKNNSELLAAQKSLESSRYSMLSLYGAYLPQLSASLGYQKGETENIDSEAYTAALVAKWNVFNGLGDQSRIRQAEGQVKIAESTLRSVQAKLSYDLKVAFASVIYAQESLKLFRSIQKRRNENLNIVELRFQSGRENKGSVLLAKAYLKQAELDVLKAENAMQTSHQALIRVLGLPPDSEFQARGGVPEAPPSLKNSSYLELARQTPERLQAEGQIQVAEASLQVSNSVFLPSLDVSGTLGKSGPDYFPDEDRWSVGATLSWSLFSGGKDYFSRQSAVAQKLVAESKWTNSELELIASLRQSFAAFREAVEQVQVSTAFVEAGTVRAEIGRSKYNNGLTTFDEWDRIENDLISYQKDQTLKRRDRVVAEATWEKTQGVGVLQ